MGFQTTIMRHIVAHVNKGVMNHFWTTGDTDNAIFRYYIDGEAEASIQFTAPKAAGAFFGDAEMWG